MTVDNIVAGQSGLTALTNLNLIINSVNGHTDGSGNLTVTDIREMSLDTTAYSPTHHEGTLYWNSDEHTLNVMSEISGCVTQVGRELWVRAINLSGVTIENGDAVYVVGASGDKVSIALARSDSESTSLTTIGLATSQITHGNIGYITILGEVHDLDTSAFTEGDLIYVSPTLAGKWTATRPVAPNTVASLGVVSRVNANNGTVVVQTRIQPTVERLSDVLITSVGNGDVLSWNSTNSRWQNTVISSGVTPTDNILDWDSTNSWYAPYTAQQLSLSFDTSTDSPIITDRLNINASLYSTSLTCTSGIVANTSLGGGAEDFAAIKAYTVGSGSSFYGESLSSIAGYFTQRGVTSGGSPASPVIAINRQQSGTSNLAGDLIYIYDNPTTSGTISGKVLTATIGATERISLNPRVADGATAVAYLLDTHNNLTTSGAKLLSIRNQNVEQVSVSNTGIINSVGINTGVVSCTGSITGQHLYLSELNTAPTSASAAGTLGDIRITADYIYVCVATNTWVRTALTTWA